MFDKLFLIFLGFAFVALLIWLVLITLNDFYEKRYKERGGYVFSTAFITGFLVAAAVACVLYFTVLPHGPTQPRIAEATATPVVRAALPVVTATPRKTATPTPKRNSASVPAGVANQLYKSVNSSVTAAPKTRYILNKSTKVFHVPSCRYVSKMASYNKIDFTGTRQQAIDKGYRPCGHCHP